MRALGGAYLPKPIAQRLRRRSASPYVASEVIDDTLVFWPTAPAFASGSIMRRELLLEIGNALFLLIELLGDGLRQRDIGDSHVTPPGGATGTIG